MSYPLKKLGAIISFKVTAGLAESNGSLLPWDDLKSHLWAHCLYTRISSGPNAQ